jgi:hypothetical protein
MLNLEGNELFLAFWSWDGGFKVVDKKPLRNFKCEHMKKNDGFSKKGVTVKADWDDHFQNFAGKTPM